MTNKTKYGKFGAYLSPVCVLGTFVPCELRGVVKVVGMSDAPISWPIGERDGKVSLVVFKGLSRALRLETAEDVAAWWGIDLPAVKLWQAGTRGPLRAPQAAQRPMPAVDNPEDRRKAWQIDDEPGAVAAANGTVADGAAALDGTVNSAASSAPSSDPWPKKWFPPVVEVVDLQTSGAYRGPKRRWEAWEDDLVRTCEVKEVVRRTQRKTAAVWARRYRLGVTSPRKNGPAELASAVVAPPPAAAGRRQRSKRIPTPA